MLNTTPPRSRQRRRKSTGALAGSDVVLSEHLSPLQLMRQVDNQSSKAAAGEDGTELRMMPSMDAMRSTVSLR
jgi:hypothetical protein